MSAFVLPPPQSERRASSSGRAVADDEQRHARRPVDEVVDEVEQAVVRPVEILEDEDERALVGDPLEEAPPGGERLVLAVAPAARVLDARQRAEVARASTRRRRPATVAATVVAELPLGLVLRVRLEDAGVRLDHLARAPRS